MGEALEAEQKAEEVRKAQAEVQISPQGTEAAGDIMEQARAIATQEVYSQQARDAAENAKIVAVSAKADLKRTKNDAEATYEEVKSSIETRLSELQADLSRKLATVERAYNKAKELADAMGAERDDAEK